MLFRGAKEIERKQQQGKYIWQCCQSWPYPDHTHHTFLLGLVSNLMAFPVI